MYADARSRCAVYRGELDYGLESQHSGTMAKRYGHLGLSARRESINKLGSATTFDAEGAQKWAQQYQIEAGQVA